MNYLYVALGDSLTAGIGANLFSPGFVQRFQRMAEAELHTQIFVQVFTHSGYLSRDILKMLEDEFVRGRMKEADIITITAGGNDLISAARQYEEDRNEKDFSFALNQCMENYRKILYAVKQLKEKSSPPFILRVIDLYNPFPENVLANKWINKFNLQLKNLAKEPNISVAEIDSIFKGHEKEYLSIDRIHPNDRGYQKIAESLNRLGYDGLEVDVEEE